MTTIKQSELWLGGEHVPFGGLGLSGYGREGTAADLDVFTEWKWITIRMS